MSKNNYAGKEVTKTVNLYAYLNEWALPGGDRYNFMMLVGEAVTGNGNIFIGETEVTMTVPDVDIDYMAVHEMKEQQDEIRAAAELALQNIEETIQSLLALPAPGEI